MGKPVFAEINPRTNKVEWYFMPSNVYLHALRNAKGTFVPKEKGGPFWTTPLDFDIVGSVAREIGKESLQMGDALEEWAWQQRAREQAIKDMLAEGDVELSRLPGVLPELAATLRPDQRVGVAYCSLNSSPLIADEMGLGKTLEAIAAVYESGTEGPSLVVCPVTSADLVWEKELLKWQRDPVFVATGAGVGRAAREDVLAEAAPLIAAGQPCWIIVNPAMVRYLKLKDEDTEKELLVSQYPVLHDTVWANVIIDEIADGGVRHPETPTAKGMFALKVKEGGKRIALTGTPWGGKPINMWGILHFLHPKHFTSKWQWAHQWLEVTHNGYGWEIGDLRADRREDFDRHMLKYMISRTKADVLKDLPPKQNIDVWVTMTPKQKKQYNDFAKLAEIKLGDETLSATSRLAEYTRLKQFANALQEVKDVTEDAFTLRSLPESGKLNMLIDDMVHLGILDRDGTKLEPGGDLSQQAVVFSQFTEMVDMLYNYFVDLGVPCAKITGDVAKKGQRKALVEGFQNEDTRIMFMNTNAGGVSITLDRASNVFIMDEMWDPDKQRQATDRCHRASRIHQVTVRYYRSKDTIEEYIKEVTDQKLDVNESIQAGHVALYKGKEKKAA